MNKICNDLSELTFADFCSEIILQNESRLDFKLKHRFHSNRHEEVFILLKTEDGLCVSDKGSTLANLDAIFELGEPNVIKNIATILKHFNIRKEGNVFSCDVDSSKEIVPQILHFLQGIHFLYTMKLFYQ